MILHIFANEQSGCWLIHYYGHTKRLIIEAQNMHMQVQYMPKRLWVKEVKKQPWSKIWSLIAFTGTSMNKKKR